jgi:4-hydroxyproline epimerase
MGRISAGTYKLETPVGIVTFHYDGKNTVSITNVPSYRYAKDVTVEVEGFGVVKGDIAWGGNWFFLVDEHGQELDLHSVEHLTEFTWQIRQALNSQGITGADGAEIDHIELFGPPKNPMANSRNFVLCPGKAYDRSPCGTGTSSKIACLIADGKLKPGEIWRQESIVGSVFEAWGEVEGDKVTPHLRGTAYVMAEGSIILQPEDPFKFGIAP